MKTYYHFVRENRLLGYGDGRLVVPGKTYTVDCSLQLCHAGLHASKRVIDALRYAPGPILCKVTLGGGEVIHGEDKVVATERTVLEIADCTPILRKFARKCALDVIHLWDAPQIVIDHLKTGDETLRIAAATYAARAAANAATYAANAAANAVYSATYPDNVATYTARAAANAASYALIAEANAADKDAAYAVRDAARDKQNKRLLAMLQKINWESNT